MKKAHRQALLLVGFMALLGSVVLFLFVYAPEPVEVGTPSASLNLPEPVNSWVNQSVQGYRAIFSDVGTTAELADS